VVDRILAGEVRTAARLMRDLDDGRPEAREILKEIYRHSGRAHIIGITGSPGVGKSTLTDRLIQYLRQEGHTVGVIAVDPTSPFSGGALLGDRVRMNIRQDKWDVFIRSMSSGRVMGGLARTTKEASRILDASGKQIIIIETVGVGQSELDIAEATDTVLVVITPESGDSIQIMKAGLMEIADIFVVNKADRPGAEDIAIAIENMLKRSLRKREWMPPMFLTSASLNEGIPQLYAGIWDHHRFLQNESRLQERRKSQLKQELRQRMEEELSQLIWQDVVEKKDIDELVHHIWAREVDPQHAARKIVWELIEDLADRQTKL